MLSPSFPGWQSKGDPHRNDGFPRATGFLVVSVMTQNRAMIGLPASGQEGVSGSPGCEGGRGGEADQAAWERDSPRVVPPGHTGTPKKAAENLPTGCGTQVADCGTPTTIDKAHTLHFR